ncbi:MAG: HNH endonuclease [Smithella sp.]|nr:HNH endonuclease [Smithella sp.]MDD5527615.1 HNH endonuclease [Patescibacteria group bacterium]
MPNNSEENYIEIGGERFSLLDEVDNIPLADSFVKNNKLQGTTGHGEAKLYVGAQQKKDFDVFFGDFSGKGLFLKKDFEDYLGDAKFEYEQQEQKYRQDISGKWEEYHRKLQGFSEREEFSIGRAVPQDQTRFYIKSEDNAFDFFRSIILPIISYVSILKLKSEQGNIKFLFRPALSYNFNPYYHPAVVEKIEKAIEQDPELTEEKKMQLREARIGQGAYRQKLMEESSECIITRVNDERILIASHIKPWSVSDEREKIDHNNGLALTPTYDRLFDQGFISFEDNGTIILSPYISPLNLKKLNLAKGRKYNIPPSDTRRAYLNYHRENIFKK